MKKYILYGYSNFTKLIKYYLEDELNVKCIITVDDEFINQLNEMEILPFSKILKECSTSEYQIINCIGYSKMNENRKNIFHKIKKHGYDLASYISPKANIAKNVKIGEGNIILENTNIQPFSEIGNGNIIWNNVNVSHDCKIENFITICGMASICGNVSIKSNSFIGNNSTIRDGVMIDEYTLVGAGAYINKNTEKFGVYKANGMLKDTRKSVDINL